MIGNGKIELTKLAFEPTESIEFVLNKHYQTAKFTLTNNEETDIIVKWKANVFIYSASPKYAIVKAKTTQRFTLICEGVERRHYETDVPVDRFTTVIIGIKPTNFKARQIWKDGALQEELFTGKVHKKYTFIVFKDRNIPNWWNFRRGVLLPTPIPTYGVVREEDWEIFGTKGKNPGFAALIIPLDNDGSKPPAEKQDEWDEDQNQNGSNE
uniref:MSP domain-containing protein n=1 Tax=Caenorhabditis tropicalis TaxID=1561998 RepID=A0A1I7SXU6_9PELO